MPTTSLMPPPKLQFETAIGTPLVGGKVYTYASGTTNPKATYTDAAGTVPHTNPIVLNVRGEPPAPIFWSGNYRVELRDALGNLVYSTDNFNTDPAQLWSLPGTLASAAGAAGVGVTQSGVGATLLTAEDRLREIRTNLDFVPKAERAAILAGTSIYDATVAVQKAIDAAGSTARLKWLGVVNTGLLSSAASVDWEFEAGAQIKLIPAVYAANSFHVTLTGPGVRLRGYNGNGNQAALAAGQGCSGLLVSGASPTVIEAKSRGYNGRGHDCNSVNIGLRRGLYIGCSFDDNAGLGMMTSAASYVDFMGCTFDRNGYGFQKTRANYADTSHGFVAFGLALRYRSHHITFTSCHARDNGRDGFNVNQGSYAIKFAHCLAYGNDDGGFTIASDNTNSGLPGESEACYDISYTDCEAYNNYSSGLAAYQVCHNVRVIGGRYYNNHRLAGNQGGASSYFNGIFFAGGSTGINVDASTYDDRQYCVVAAAVNGVITATNWVPGAMTIYPKVAVYNGTDQSFRGYAKITAESAGSVTITPTANNGVGLASIVAGDYITQAVQHCGVFTDNSCQGVIAAEGGGLRPGAAGGPGRLIYSGGYASGQNIILPKERQSATELLVNPTFDASLAGWTFNLPGGGTADPFIGTPRRSAGALRLVGGTSSAQGDAAFVAGTTEAVAGNFAELGGWVYSAARDGAVLVLFWFIGASTFYTEMHHPGGGWRYLKIGVLFPGEITGLVARVVTTTGKTAYFDSMSFRQIEQHADSREFTFPTRALPY